MVDFKVGDIVMWATANYWEKYNKWAKDIIISETKTEFKTQKGERILKNNNKIRGYEYRQAILFDLVEWNKDIIIRNKLNMKYFIIKNFEKYSDLLNAEEIKKLYSEMKTKIGITEGK